MVRHAPHGGSQGGGNVKFSVGRPDLEAFAARHNLEAKTWATEPGSRDRTHAMRTIYGSAATMALDGGGGNGVGGGGTSKVALDKVDALLAEMDLWSDRTNCGASRRRTRYARATPSHPPPTCT